MLILASRLATVAATSVVASLGVVHPQPHHETLHVSIAAAGQQVVGTTYLESDTVSRGGQPFGLAVLTCPGAARPGVRVAHCFVDFGLENGTLQGRLAINNDTGVVTGTVTSGAGTYARSVGLIKGNETASGALLTIRINRSR